MWIVTFIIIAIALALMGDNTLLMIGLKIFLFLIAISLFGLAIGSSHGYIFLFGIAIFVCALLISIFFGEKIKNIFIRIPKKIKIIFFATIIILTIIIGVTHTIYVSKEKNAQQKEYNQLLSLRDKYKEILPTNIYSNLCKTNGIENIEINPFYVEDETDVFFDYLEINITLNQNTHFDSLNQSQQDTITNQIIKDINNAYITSCKKNNKYIEMISNYNNHCEEFKYITINNISVSTNITLNMYYNNKLIVNEIVLLN